MKHSYFSQPLSGAELCARIAVLDPTARVEISENVTIQSAARAVDMGPTSIGYFDGKAWIGSASKVGMILTNQSCQTDIKASIKIVSDTPRQLFIRLINAVLDDVPLDYERTISEMDGQCTHGKSRIHETALIMPGSLIGVGCVIEPAAIIFPGVVLEDGVCVKAAAIIGSSGAAIDVKDDATLSQPHLGTVLVGANTEIGSQANVVRGIFGATRIGQRCVVGNRTNIGHNVEVGDGVWVGAGAIIAGYTRVGSFTNIGMGALCKNGLTIGANCNIAAGSCLTKNMPDGVSCFGNPAKIIKFKLSAGPAKPFPIAHDAET